MTTEKYSSAPSPFPTLKKKCHETQVNVSLSLVNVVSNPLFPPFRYIPKAGSCILPPLRAPPIFIILAVIGKKKIPPSCFCIVQTLSVSHPQFVVSRPLLSPDFFCYLNKSECFPRYRAYRVAKNGVHTQCEKNAIEFLSRMYTCTPLGLKRLMALHPIRRRRRESAFLFLSSLAPREELTPFLSTLLSRLPRNTFHFRPGLRGER